MKGHTSELALSKIDTDVMAYFWRIKSNQEGLEPADVQVALILHKYLLIGQAKSVVWIPGRNWKDSYLPLARIAVLDCNP